METTRQEKINRLIQKELSSIFLLETKKMHGVLVSVSAVRITPDLSLAKIYISIFPGGQAEDIFKNVSDNARTLRYQLGLRVGKQLRVIPELVFYLDDTLDYFERIDKLLSSQNPT